MRRPTLFQRNTNALALSLLLVASPHAVFAEDAPEPAPATPYSSTHTVVLEDGTSLAIVIANSPSTPPQQNLAAKSLTVSAVAKAADTMITDVPIIKWSWGTSNTSGAMIAGYYDRKNYTDMYTGPTNGGVMPLTQPESWGINECPLSATKKGLDGRTSRGHVDDYYNVLPPGPGIDPNFDPYFVQGWPEHTPGECTGDYMKTNKWFPGSKTLLKLNEDINKDGAAVFIFDLIQGTPIYASFLKDNGYDKYDAGYGLKLFFESRCYTVANMYNQPIDTVKPDVPGYGFNYDDYKAEIEAGRPVMLHLSGHIVVGVGYNATTTHEIIIHDPWNGKARMTWGGKYLGRDELQHTAVTVVTLAGATNRIAGCSVASGKKFPWTMFLPAITGSK